MMNEPVYLDEKGLDVLLYELIAYINTKLPKSGGTITGDLNIKGNLTAQPASYEYVDNTDIEGGEGGGKKLIKK